MSVAEPKHERNKAEARIFGPVLGAMLGLFCDYCRTILGKTEPILQGSQGKMGATLTSI
jgi:hypothetical protein